MISIKAENFNGDYSLLEKLTRIYYPDNSSIIVRPGPIFVRGGPGAPELPCEFPGRPCDTPTVNYVNLSSSSDIFDLPMELWSHYWVYKFVRQEPSYIEMVRDLGLSTKLTESIFGIPPRQPSAGPSPTPANPLQQFLNGEVCDPDGKIPQDLSSLRRFVSDYTYYKIVRDCLQKYPGDYIHAYPVRFLLPTNETSSESLLTERHISRFSKIVYFSDHFPIDFVSDFTFYNKDQEIYHNGIRKTYKNMFFEKLPEFAHGEYNILYAKRALEENPSLLIELASRSANSPATISALLCIVDDYHGLGKKEILQNLNYEGDWYTYAMQNPSIVTQELWDKYGPQNKRLWCSSGRMRSYMHMRAKTLSWELDFARCNYVGTPANDLLYPEKLGLPAFLALLNSIGSVINYPKKLSWFVPLFEDLPIRSERICNFYLANFYPIDPEDVPAKDFGARFPKHPYFIDLWSITEEDIDGPFFELAIRKEVDNHVLNTKLCILGARRVPIQCVPVEYRTHSICALYRYYSGH